jgi:hypothetical protein
VKHYKLNMTFDVTVSDITPQSHMAHTARAGNAEELVNAQWWWQQAGRQRHLLRALCADETALRQFLARALADEMSDLPGDTTLADLLNATEGDEYDILLQTALKLEAEDAEYFKGANDEGLFSESTAQVTNALSVELTAATLVEAE